MNLRHVARLLSGFILFFTFAMAVPLLVSLSDGSSPGHRDAFLLAIAVGFGTAAILFLAGTKARQGLFRKEGLAVVGIAWFLAGAIAAIPFTCSNTIPSYVDSYFESISGLTTTGATVLGTANIEIESLAPSMLLWRAMLQWLGGIGIVLVFIVLLPSMGVTGSRLLSSEQIGMSDESARPRLADQSRQLFLLYTGLTLAACLAYWAFGMSLFDAVCHAFTTMATGGFSNHNVSMGGYQNVGIEIVAITFMFLAGCNFLLVLRVMTRRGRPSPSGALHRREFAAYLGITLVVALGITISLWVWAQPLRDDSLGITHDYRQFGRCLRDGLFQSVSILTSTGYANADFEQWPKPALYLVFICMLVGGCTGSTAGGFKVMRLLVCAKVAAHTLRCFVRPRIVEKIRVGPEVVPDRLVSTVVGLLLLWMGTVAAGTLVLDLDPRLDLMTAFTASVSMMGCIGPAFGEVIPADPTSFQIVGKIDLGPYSGYGELYPAAKLFMSLQMVLGRLEILAPLALLTPRFWRR